MRHRILRNRFAVAGSLIVAAMTMATTLGAGPASANPPTPALGTSPHFFVGAPEQIRDVGSDTTFFAMQRLSDLFEQAGLYGCVLNGGIAPNNSLCNRTGLGTDVIATTDVNDNYDHIEVITGLGNIGSGNGQKQLCGTQTAPFGGGNKNTGTQPGTANFNPDFARSSKAVDTTLSCAANMVGLGFAKDAVPPVDFPGAEGTGVATDATGQWSSQVVGPVAAGWLPGNSITCDQGAPLSSPNPLNTVNGCGGVPVTDISNVGGTSSEAYNLWCNTGVGRISDWAQLTNLTGSETPGQGATIPGHPLPILIPNINNGSGTTATFQIFVGCSLPTTNETAATTLCAGASVLENNSAQYGDCLAASYPASVADQAAAIASSLAYEGNGAFNSNIHTRIVSLTNGTQYAAVKMTESGSAGNDIVASTAPGGSILTNNFPSSRTLYNIYRTDQVRASTADFLNWICDSNNLYTKNTDNNTGQNYNNEITAALQTSFGFIRLNSQTAAPNNSCTIITAVADASS